jgi:hypothetical protein
MPRGEDLEAFLAGSRWEAEASPWRDLRIGERRFRLAPMR